MAAEAKLILEEGNAYEFDLNDRVNTFLQEGFAIPAAEPSEQGQRKKERGVLLGPADFNRLNLPIPFRLVASGSQDFIARQRILIKALNLPRPRLTWNPNPDVCTDVYFEAYSGQLNVPLGFNYFVHHKEDLSISLLVDPFPCDSDVTIFDQVTVLGQVDGETGEWTGNSFSVDTNRYVQGSKSAHTQATSGAWSWLQRLSSSQILLNPFILRDSWVTVPIYVETSGAMANFQVRIGTDASNYRQYDMTHGIGEQWAVNGWQYLFFDFNAPASVVGTPNMGDTRYLYVAAHLYLAATGPAFNIDNVHIVNGKVCNVRGQTPLATIIYGVGGEYPCGFKADFRAGATLQLLAMGDDEAGQWTASGAGVSVALVTAATSHSLIDPMEGTYCIEGNFANCTSGTLIRTPSPALDLSPLSAAGSAQFSTSLWDSNGATVEFRIGQSVNHYRKIAVTIAPQSNAYQTFKFLLSDMTVGAGSPTWTNITYIAFYVSGLEAASYHYIYFDASDAFEPGAAIDLMWLTRGQEGIEAPLGVLLPESSPIVPTGVTWEATPAAITNSTADGCYMHAYYRWVIGATEKMVYPAKLMADKYKGEHRLLARVRTSDTGGGTVRMIGYDENSGGYVFSDPVTVGFNSGSWQTIDITSLCPPFDGFGRDAVLSQTFSIVGLAITSVGASKNWDVNIIEVAPTEGGARSFTPIVGKRFSCWDSRYHDSMGYSQGPAADATAQSVQRKRATGDLMTLEVGTNNLLTIARDSSAPNSVSSIDLTKLIVTPRLKNGN